LCQHGHPGLLRDHAATKPATRALKTTTTLCFRDIADLRENQSNTCDPRTFSEGIPRLELGLRWPRSNYHTAEPPAAGFRQRATPSPAG
jgi:hypothetical protein